MKEVQRQFQGSFKGVSKKVKGVQETFKGDSRKLQGYPKKVQWVFHGSFKAVLKKCQVCSKKISNNKVPRVFQECFNEVLFCDFIVAWILSQLPE